MAAEGVFLELSNHPRAYDNFARVLAGTSVMSKSALCLKRFIS